MGAAVGQKWFGAVYRFPHCWLSGHIKFINPGRGTEGEETSPHGSVIVFMGEKVDKFCEVFSKVGYISGRPGAWCKRSYERWEIREDLQ